MQRPLGLDPEPAAQRIQRRRRTGKLLARDQQGINGLIHRQKRQFDPAQFRIQKFHVEGRVVDHQLGIPDKIQKLRADLRKDRLVAQEIIAQPVHFKGGLRHRPLRVDVFVKRPTRRHVIVQLDRPDFDDTVPFRRFKTRGFGIQNDLTHGLSAF